MTLKIRRTYFVKRDDDCELIPDSGRRVTATSVTDAIRQWAQLTGHKDASYFSQNKGRWFYWAVPIRVSKI